MKLIDFLTEKEAEEDIFKPFDLEKASIAELKKRLQTSYPILINKFYYDGKKDKILELLRSNKIRRFPVNNEYIQDVMFDVYIHKKDYEFLDELFKIIETKFPKDLEDFYQYWLKLAVGEEDLRLFNKIIDKIKNVNTRDNNEYTFLMRACEVNGNGNFYMVKKLIERGADVNVYTKKPHTGLNLNSPLLLAFISENYSIISLLLNHPQIDVNLKNETMNLPPPLYVAVLLNNLKIIKMLLNHKDIDVNIVYMGKTPLDLALSKTHGEIAKLLLKHGAKIQKEDLAQYKRFLQMWK